MTTQHQDGISPDAPKAKATILSGKKRAEHLHEELWGFPDKPDGNN